MKRFALLGEPLGHSLSPVLHKAIYRQLEIDDASYRAIELSEDSMQSFFAGFRIGGFDGVNVTIPHKTAVISMLDEVDSKAKLINAVNCINRSGNKLTGFNTDLLGFAYSLRQHDVNIEGNEFAILGAGGSAQAVGAVLAEGEAKMVSIVNRTPEKAEALKEIILNVNSAVQVVIVSEDQLVQCARSLDCVINTTSLGMAPNIQGSPIASEVFTQNTLAFDLIYNPLKTRFLTEAEKQGALTVNGIQMLVAQAVYSMEIWMGGNILAHVDMNALVKDLEKALK